MGKLQGLSGCCECWTTIRAHSQPPHHFWAGQSGSGEFSTHQGKWSWRWRNSTLLALNCLQPYRDPVQFSQVKHSVTGKAGWGPASSENQHRLTSIPSHPSLLLGLKYFGIGRSLAPSSESTCHFFHVLAWLSPSQVSRQVSFTHCKPFSLGFSERVCVSAEFKAAG